MGLSLDSADAVELFEFERAQVGLAMKGPIKFIEKQHAGYDFGV
jgi:hypothetical protein